MHILGFYIIFHRYTPLYKEYTKELLIPILAYLNIYRFTSRLVMTFSHWLCGIQVDTALVQNQVLDPRGGWGGGGGCYDLDRPLPLTQHHAMLAFCLHKPTSSACNPVYIETMFEMYIGDMI